MDMEFGPDGALYVLEYGDGYFAENPDAQLVAIDYVAQRQPHAGRARSRRRRGRPRAADGQFSSAGTDDPDGDRLKYAWDFDADGTVDSTEPTRRTPTRRTASTSATLRVTDQTGRSASADVRHRSSATRRRWSS